MTGLRVPSLDARENLRPSISTINHSDGARQLVYANAGERVGPGALPVPAQPTAIAIDERGHVSNARVQVRITPAIERGPMRTVNGIIVHQTGGSTAQSTFASYAKADANGAHFLIDKDGTIYQTASVKQRSNHAGNLKARCVAESRCTPTDLKALTKKGPGRGIGDVERGKQWPDRYPGNTDSIGIELVGAAKKDPKTGSEVYEDLTQQQQGALAWLLGGLSQALGVSMKEVFRHPTVSWKNATEAASAKW